MWQTQLQSIGLVEEVLKEEFEPLHQGGFNLLGPHCQI
jgi:hypothetical protein